jgi:hypothetical protein
MVGTGSCCMSTKQYTSSEIRECGNKTFILCVYMCVCICVCVCVCVCVEEKEGGVLNFQIQYLK